jgi:xanthosine utilization system XapX-like protein
VAISHEDVALGFPRPPAPAVVGSEVGLLVGAELVVARTESVNMRVGSFEDDVAWDAR